MNLVTLYKEGDMTTKLIFINSAVFLLVCLLMFVDMICSSGVMQTAESALSLSSNLTDNLIFPWRIITFMFLHENFIHFIINILLLSFAGKLFYEFWGSSEMLKVYFLGGILGGIAFIVTCAISDEIARPLCGASASIMALITACVVYAPNYEIRLTLIGDVKIKWILFVFALISAFNMFGTNWLGEISHIGGIIGGAMFVMLYNKSNSQTNSKKDNSDNFLGKIFSRERKPKMKLYRNPNRNSTSGSNYNASFSISTEEERLDAILDKIKKSGFDSLSDNEKEFLDKFGNRNGKN